ncbi:MAG: hypothetical protein K2Y22_14535 [Candidatus Obscuribacterales bacterium]|nr:hypothetical protein [Candidatus Obscuribacterales bacterium]
MSLIDTEAYIHELEQEERREKQRPVITDIIVRGLKSKYPGHEIGPAFEEKDSRGVIWTHIPVAKAIYEQVYTEIGFHPFPRYTIDELKDESPSDSEWLKHIPNDRIEAAKKNAEERVARRPAGKLEEVGDISDLFEDRHSD